jgi:hypothetical protein
MLAEIDRINGFAELSTVECRWFFKTGINNE